MNVHAKSRLILGCLCGNSGQETQARRKPARTGRGPSPARYYLLTLPTIVPGSANEAASSAAAVNGSNRIVLSCPRSTDINTLTCLDDPY